MATASAPATSLLSLLYRSYPRVVPFNSTEPELTTLSPKIFPTAAYTDAENAEINSWLSKTSELAQALKKGETESASSLMDDVNKHLATRTTILGAKPSIVDIALYALIAPEVEKWSPEQRTGENGRHHIVRHVDFVQNAALLNLQIPEEEKIAIDVNDVRAPPKAITPAKDEGNKKKKEKKNTGQGGEKNMVVGRGKNANTPPEDQSLVDKNTSQDISATGTVAGAAAAVAPKKEKKEKKPKPQKAPAAPAAPPSPSLIDLRVGHILRAINHPNADSLYVSTIACGDAPGSDNTSQDEATGLTVRTVCSGLNGLVPLEEMQGRKVVTVCNLKPVTMRGIKSAAMVLAASPKDDDSHAGPVELVSPPAGAEAGERVFFDGWGDGEPEKVLNPKKKIWETFQPGFTTSNSLEVVFDSSAVPQLSKEGEGSEASSASPIGKLVTQSGGVCTVKSLKGATVR
ncbi:G4 quadruplex nucleic acid binding protein [Ophidiomyces ophidiicola]|uniref:G4 quadruplex nucleic acid binding protein n=1 Tax=Ophidiomyces ophidiicola TaxID=1387563 RepID=A0ACB8UR33_9EURO|nr:G4 quadruplex nucleic acid binding protein [Ophidiomyces ophidiicola]KAI1952471.1 G4 quadruplex nucleic acid binding protein [Ophidiomyces ophidiicola]KAI1969495.1 G4 quadruplex nucleic acid binding protein [Ophidiomyces ophidiicola]KAI2019385.1 G4 quadruplex nucleic acid binding protein [Ophidiomyces ophidiicola]KAI2035719.1 G4 quadruplex nucleic acid binding protein [Ophidiomyces ophidiicola]